MEEFKKKIALAVIRLLNDKKLLSAKNIAKESGYTIRDIELNMSDVYSICLTLENMNDYAKRL